MQVELGKEARDKITGFTGIVTAKVQYLTGCNQTLLAPSVGNDGRLTDPAWFDDQRIEAVENGRTVSLDNSATPGPDKPAPKR
jgi:hypothetical protein